MKICPVGTQLFHVDGGTGRTERHDEANGRFSRLERTVILSFYDFDNHKNHRIPYTSLRSFNIWVPLYNIVETADVGILIYCTVVGVYRSVYCAVRLITTREKQAVGEPTAIEISVHRHIFFSRLTCFVYERKNIAPLLDKARKIRLKEP